MRGSWYVILKLHRSVYNSLDFTDTTNRVDLNPATTNLGAFFLTSFETGDCRWLTMIATSFWRWRPTSRARIANEPGAKAISFS
jgi:hypothetical protein